MRTKDIRHNAPPLSPNLIRVHTEIAKEAQERSNHKMGKELPTNPYSGVGKIENAQDIRNKKVRQVMAQRKTPHEKAYGWSMGYNNLVGRYSVGQTPTLSGSSLNRKLRPKYAKGLHYWANRLIAVARTLDPYFSGELGRNWPVYRAAMWPTAENEAEYRAWLSEMDERRPCKLRVPIYVLSDRSKGKIRDKATAFYRSCPGQRVFATLTFVDRCDDTRAMVILNKFLTEARKKFPGIQYLWVAERQNENWKYPGNIHFHMILNKRLPVGRWNAFWILTQYNAGLIGEDKNGRPVTKREIMDAYALDVQEQFKNKRLQGIFNPFDIRKVTSISKLSTYLTKYITKQEKGVRFACLPWHCSRRVSRMFTRALVSPSAFRYMQSFANWGIDRTTGEMFKPVEQKGQFWVVIYSANKAAPLPFLRKMEQVNKWIGEGYEVDQLTLINDDLYRDIFIKKDT